MAFKRHTYPKRRKITKADPYKSGLEKRLAEVLHHCEYEKVKIKYIIPCTYNPDFSFPDKPWLVIEAKGRFINGSSEARKYVEVAKQHKDKEVVFIFEKPTTKAYTGLKRRRDGTIMTLGEWAAKNNFVFFGEKEIPLWFIEGDFDRDKLLEVKRELRREWLGK